MILILIFSIITLLLMQNIIDAKSILGVMGLDFNSTLTVKYAGDNHEFESYVNTLCVA